MKNTLILIFAALALMIGSFIWFVASWDAEMEQPVSIILPEKLTPEGRYPFAPPAQEVIT